MSQLPLCPAKHQLDPGRRVDEHGALEVSRPLGCRLLTGRQHVPDLRHATEALTLRQLCDVRFGAFWSRQIHTTCTNSTCR